MTADKGYISRPLGRLWIFRLISHCSAARYIIAVEKCRFENAVHESGKETEFLYFGNIKDIHPTYFKFITK